MLHSSANNILTWSVFNRAPNVAKNTSSCYFFVDCLLLYRENKKKIMNKQTK